MSSHISNVRPEPDQVLVDMVDYVLNYQIESTLAYETARNCLIDTLGCGLEALEYPACRKLLGPIVPGTVVPNGAKVPGTQFQLDPVQAAFNIGAMIRWLDFNDTWLAAEWGHPSDNLGGILATADWLSRNAVAAGKTADDIKQITIRTHEACIRIIDKKGPLNNPADRDHCIQYMVAVPVLFGRRTDGIPLLEDKFRTNLARVFPTKQQNRILEVSLDQKALEAMPVHEYVDMYVI